MKALTLHQPYATLIALGAKKIETRSWPTPHRGMLAIHAAATMPHDVQLALTHPAFVDKLRPAGFTLDARGEWQGLPLGAVVAVCHVVDCVRVEALETTPISIWEWHFGDYTPGRYAWKLGDVRALAIPIRTRGAQQLWTVPDHVEAQVRGAVTVAG